MKKVTFNSVQYTSKFINANFRIKAHGLRTESSTTRRTSNRLLNSTH